MGLRIKSSQSLGHRIATLMAVFALVFQPVSGFVAGQLASAAPDTVYASTGFDSLSWAVDRKAPASHSITSNSFSMTIDPAIAGASDYSKQEGFNAAINSNITSIKAGLYIDPAWEGKKVSTSLWGQTGGSKNAWPRVEFTNKDGFPHITSMRSLGGEPVYNGSVPVSYGSTVTVEVAVDTASKRFVFYANDVEFYSYGKSNSTHNYPPSWADGYDPYFVPFNKMFVKAWNTGVDGDNYTATWKNLQLGVYAAAPKGLTITRDGTSADVTGTVVKDANHTLRWTGTLESSAVWNVRVTHPDGTENTSRRSSTNWFDLNDTVRHGHFGTQQGVYKYEVRQQQQGAPYAGMSDWSAPVYLTFDDKAPVVDPITANGYAFATDDTAVVSGVDGIEFKFTITDEFAGHDYTYAEVKKSNGEWVQGTSGLHLRGSNPTWQIPASKTQTQGNYVLKLSARDKIGNGKSVEYKFRIDNTLPTFNLFDGQNPRKPINSGDYVNLHRLSGGADQLEQVYFSGKNSTDTLYLNGSPIFGHGYYERTNSGKIGTAFGSEGEYTLYTKNTLGTQSAAVAFTVDETNPVIHTPTVNFVSGEKTFGITQTEVNPDRAYVEYMRKDAGGVYRKMHGQWFNDTNSLNYTVDTARWADGDYQVKISSWDKANNHSSASFRFVTDNTPPDFTNVSNGDLVNTPSFEVRINEANLSSVTVNGVAVSYTGSAPNYSVTVSGERSHTVVASDGVNEPSTVTFTIDTTAPAVSAFAVGPAADSLTTTLHGVVDDASSYQWTLVGANGGVTIADQNSLVTAVTVPGFGTYTFRLTAIDAAGNVSYSDVPVTFAQFTSVDTDRPSTDRVTNNTEEEEEEETASSLLNPGIVAALDDQNANASDDEGDVLAEEVNAQDNNTQGEVLADEDEANDGCAKFLGLCWYWWIPIALAVVLVGWIIRGMLREDDDLPPARRQ